jgi:NAD(P)-dependent dehydrogenase (short-subunit alcohol dehydrogenase family)
VAAHTIFSSFAWQPPKLFDESRKALDVSCRIAQPDAACFDAAEPGRVTGQGVRAVYASSNAAVVAPMKSLVTEFGPHGIRVNAIVPGAHRRCGRTRPAPVLAGRAQSDRTTRQRAQPALREFADVGAPMSYRANRRERCHRLGWCADRIRNGAKPASCRSLWVDEQPPWASYA